MNRNSTEKKLYKLFWRDNVCTQIPIRGNRSRSRSFRVSGFQSNNRPNMKQSRFRQVPHGKFTQAKRRKRAISRELRTKSVQYLPVFSHRSLIFYAWKAIDRPKKIYQRSDILLGAASHYVIFVDKIEYNALKFVVVLLGQPGAQVLANDRWTSESDERESKFSCSLHKTIFPYSSGIEIHTR